MLFKYSSIAFKMLNLLLNITKWDLQTKNRIIYLHIRHIARYYFMISDDEYY